MFKPHLSLIFLFFLAACQLSDSTEGKEFRARNLKKIEVMSYNLENLFDTQHDRRQGKDLQDYMYLPKESEFKRDGCQKIRSNYWQKKCFETDWTQEKLNLRISQLARVIRRGDQGRLPDILAVSEIENERVAKMLGEYLGMDQFVITSGEDERGIEVAVFYRQGEEQNLKLVSHSEHKLEGRTTRSILEVEFLINAQYPLVIYVNHWPSQGSPSSARIEQANLLSKLIKNKRSESDSAHVLALGDFNTLEAERPHPFQDVLLKKTQLQDLHQLFNDSSYTDKHDKEKLPLGTYFYAPKMSWNLLDRVFVGQSLLDHEKLEVLPESFEIYAPEFAVQTYTDKKKSSAHFGSVVQGVPKRANFKTTQKEKAGFSDHFPLVFTLAY